MNVQAALQMPPEQGGNHLPSRGGDITNEFVKPSSVNSPNFFIKNLAFYIFWAFNCAPYLRLPFFFQNHLILST